MVLGATTEYVTTFLTIFRNRLLSIMTKKYLSSAMLTLAISLSFPFPATANKLANDQRAVQAYCDWADASYALSQNREREYEANPSEAAQSAIYEKYETLQRELLESIVSQLGTDSTQFYDASSSGHWDWHCRARERGWQVLTDMQAREATRSDARKAREAAEAFYIFALDKRVAHFFNATLYSAVNCDWQSYDDYRIVGCRLEGLGRKTDWDLYVVGRLANGELGMAPLNGQTEQHISRSGISTALDERARNRRYFNAYDEFKAYFALFAGDPFDIAEVRDEF